MRRPSSDSPQEQDLWLQNAVLVEIVSLHPARLTAKELVIRMGAGPSDMGQAEIMDSLQALKGSGLVRFTEEVVELTFAALRAAAIFGI